MCPCFHAHDMPGYCQIVLQPNTLFVTGKDNFQWRYEFQILLCHFQAVVQVPHESGVDVAMLKIAADELADSVVHSKQIQITFALLGRCLEVERNSMAAFIIKMVDHFQLLGADSIWETSRLASMFI